MYEEDQVQPINIRGSVVDIAHDYVKRKHVFRLALQSGSEYLFQVICYILGFRSLKSIVIFKSRF